MRDVRFRWRIRLIACCVGLTALSFVQSPGLIVNDTKYDLVVRPGLFVAKVLHLWDPLGEFGQVQNQAYGYLFPMGPFFLLGNLMAAPGWVIQRAWWALILVVAFLGVVKLCAVLRIGSPWARILAGLAFALSPRMLTNLGPISIENWPSALAPWVLIPLVIGAQRGSARQAAARSALAAAFVGGVNAVASAAVVPIAALWLLTRRRGPRRGTMMRWWPVFMALATLWWLVPLAVLGRYSPPFLDYIESARATTTPATIVDALRGTTKWVPYVTGDPSAGRTLLTEPMMILQSGLLVVVGLLGLTRRDMPERRFLVVSLLAGVVLVTMGHLGEVQGLWAESLRGQLDGLLAPLRNTHKWDVLIRLPLVLGLAHLVSAAGTKLVRGRRKPREDQVVLRAGVHVLVAAAFLGSSSVAFSASLASGGGFERTPAYWTAATQWLAAHDDGRRTFVTPGSPFGDYTWGRPMDEAIQALSDAPWATRSVIPLVPGSTIRMMDAIESRIVDGQGSDGLHDYLSRAGVGFVLVRRDLNVEDLTPNAARVNAAIASTPGLVRAAAFGPLVGGDYRLDREDRSAAFIADGLQAYHRSIEIYRVIPNAGEAAATVYPDADLPVFVGDASTVLRSLELAALGPRPVQFARDAEAGVRPSEVLLTDGSRRQEVDYGRVHENRSASHTLTEPWQTERRVRDYSTGSAVRWLSVPRLEGASALSATSSASNAEYFGEIDQSALPFAAIDGDRQTAWVSGVAVKGRHALTVRFRGPVEVDRIRLGVPNAVRARTRSVTVTTENGSVRTGIAPGDTKTVTTTPGPTSFVTVSTTSDLGQPLRISTLAVPGQRFSRPLVLPAIPDSWPVPRSVLLSTDTGERSGCVVVDGDTRCAEYNETLSEDRRTLDRVVRLPGSADFETEVFARPWGTDALSALLQSGRRNVASASSQATHQAVSGAFAAVDSNRATGWVAAESDIDPSLTLAWPKRQRLTSIRVRTSSGLVASTASKVTIDFGDGSTRTVDLSDGAADFRPVTARRATVRFIEDDEATTVDLDGQSGRSLPVGVSEISFPGAPFDDGPLSAEPQVLACGSGPDLTIAGTDQSTALVASPVELYADRTVRARPCTTTEVSLGGGENRVTASPSTVARPVGVRLLRPGASEDADVGRAAQVDHPDAASTVVTLPEGGPSGLLVLRINQNEGWVARGSGRDLSPVTVDGWQQGWRLPGNSEVVNLHFGPDTVYRAGLLGGLVGAFLVLLASFSRRFAQRGRAAHALQPLRIGWLPATVLVSGFAVAVGGWGGLAAAGAGWLLGTAFTLWGFRGGRWPVLLLGSGVALAFATVWTAYALRPWGTELAWMGFAGWPQLLALVGLTGSLAAVFVPESSRLLSRIAGRSMR